MIEEQESFQGETRAQLSKLDNKVADQESLRRQAEAADNPASVPAGPPVVTELPPLGTGVAVPEPAPEAPSIELPVLPAAEPTPEAGVEAPSPSRTQELLAADILGQRVQELEQELVSSKLMLMQQAQAMEIRMTDLIGRTAREVVEVSSDRPAPAQASEQSPFFYQEESISYPDYDPDNLKVEYTGVSGEFVVRGGMWSYQNDTIVATLALDTTSGDKLQTVAVTGAVGGIYAKLDLTGAAVFTVVFSAVPPDWAEDIYYLRLAETVAGGKLVNIRSGNIGPTVLDAIKDHGDLEGLEDDDHPQYLTEGRHDSLSSDNPHSVTFTQAVSADPGTDITAAEAETLTDESNADALHEHAHSATTGQTVNDHHDKTHAHNGADGSGTVAHSDTTGQAADDHHDPVTLSTALDDNLLAITDQVLDLDTQAAALVFSGPATGAAAKPTFRALETTDMPTGVATSISNEWETGIGDGIYSTTIQPLDAFAVYQGKLFLEAGVMILRSKQVCVDPEDGV